MDGRTDQEIITTPIVLTGTQTLEILDADVVIKANITLRDSAVLTIRRSTVTHQVDYNQQYSLDTCDRSSVVIEDATGATE